MIVLHRTFKRKKYKRISIKETPETVYVSPLTSAGSYPDHEPIKKIHLKFIQPQDNICKLFKIILMISSRNTRIFFFFFTEVF